MAIDRAADPVPPADRAAAQPAGRRGWWVLLLRVSWLPVLLVVGWQLEVQRSGLPTLVLPGPLQVLDELIEHWRDYLAATLHTLLIAIGGTALGLLIGYAGALLSSISQLSRYFLNPGMVVLRSVPVIAMLPVLARVLGYGELTVVAATAVVAFFPAFVYTGSALASVPPAARDLLAALGAGRLTRLRRLELAYSLAGLATGARLAAATCMLAALTSEFLVSGGGLGGRLALSQAYLQARACWAIFLIAMLLSAALYWALKPVESRARRAVH